MENPLAGVAATFRERWVEVQDGVEIRLLEWRPEQPTAAPVVLVAGWISVLEGWLDVLETLARTRLVLYVETREKRSAQIRNDRMRPAEFTVHRLAEDLLEVAGRVGLEVSRSTFLGSSMGANAILEALKYRRLQPRAAFLVGPNASFHIPLWGRPLLYTPSVSYQLARPFVEWYLRRFRVDAEREPEQMRRYERTLRAAEPDRLKLSARAIVDYRVWDGLETIEAPVAIGFADSDTLHAEREVRAIVAQLPRGEAVRCASNTAMHSAEVVEIMDAFLDRSAPL